MKLAVRIFALSVAVAGLTAAASTSRTAVAAPSHLSATSPLPAPVSFMPACGKGLGCGGDAASSK